MKILQTQGKGLEELRALGRNFKGEEAQGTKRRDDRILQVCILGEVVGVLGMRNGRNQ